MTKTIAAVPESITRAQYVALVESLGFNPGELIRLEFDRDGIWAEVRSRNPDGSPITNAPVSPTHTIHIPVVDPPTPADWNAPPDQSATPPTDLR